MKVYTTFLIAALSLVLLSGCQTIPADNGKTDISGSDKQKVSHDSQQRTAIALTEKNALRAGKITANSQFLSVDWDGDAIELLSQMAHQRGIVLRISGVRLPLPVNLHETDITFNTLLRLIRTQTAWRTTVTQHADALEVLFMPAVVSRG